MRISSIGKVVAVMVIVGSVSFPAFAADGKTTQAVDCIDTGNGCPQDPRPVPEPGMFGLLGLGIAGIIIARRRK